MQREQVHPMKSFRLPDGLRVWNAPDARAETDFLYREIFRRHCYEKHGVAVSDGSIVFDVGANVGMFGLSLMDRFRDLRIFSFEPVPSTYACLERNLLESGRQSRNRVTTLNLALGAADGEMTMEYFPNAPGNSTLYSREKHRDFARVLDSIRWSDIWRTNKPRALLCLPLFPFRKRLLGPSFKRVLARGVSMQCRVRTLSEVIREHPVNCIDLLKIDVEGAELDVLEGLEEQHWPLVRQLAIEVEPANKARLSTLIPQLKLRGFSQITAESMFGGPITLDDAVPCNLYAVR